MKPPSRVRLAIYLGVGVGLLVGVVAWGVLHWRGHSDRVGGAIVGATLVAALCIAGAVASRYRSAKS